MLLCCHTHFSLRYGTLSPEALVSLLQELGYTAFAVSDINNTSAIWDTLRLATDAGLHAVPGVDFRDAQGRCRYVALARSLQGLEQINRLLSAVLQGEKELPDQPEGLAEAILIYPLAFAPGRTLAANEYIGLSLADLRKFPALRDIPAQKCVFLQAFSFAHKRQHNLHRLLRAIHANTLLSKLTAQEQATADEIFQPQTHLVRGLAAFPDIMARSIDLLRQCHVQIDYGSSKNKSRFTLSATQDKRLLEKLAYDGLQYRYGRKHAEAERRVKHELDIIHRMGFTTYFLITEDIVRYATHRGFFHVGRGSGANSIVAYCLRITDVDPIELDLYFERFINPHRTSPPDFDLDFSWRDRDEVLQYIFQRYGHNHTALLASYVTFQGKSVLRELGKVFGLPPQEIDVLSSLPADARLAEGIPAQIMRYGQMMQGMPNHLGIHAGGVLISEAPIFQYTATSLPPKGFPTTQFDMYVAEDIGLYKYDILSQRGLGHIRDAVEWVRRNQEQEIDIHRIQHFKKDPAIHDLIQTGRTMGCFYVESPAMRQLLAKLRCRDYITLVAASSIIRPGVARSGMMREYIRRFHHPNSFEYIHPKMKELLSETYGVMVYQEDVIKVAHHFAGLDPAEADILRRGMSGKFRSAAEFKRVADAFRDNCRNKGYPDAITDEVWRQIESFSGYSFSKAHSASFAVESFQSLYLKAHFPLEFITAVLNNFGGFYKTEDYVHEARMLGADVQAPCVNRSEALCLLQDRTIFLGLGLLHSLEQQSMNRLLEERQQQGPYSGLADCLARTGLSLEQVVILIRAGAFRFTGKPKKVLLWEAHTLLNKHKSSLVSRSLFTAEEPVYALPELSHSAVEDAYDEMELLGFALASPFDLVDAADETSLVANDFSAYLGKNMVLWGYVVAVKDTRTVKGERMQFGCFTDRQGRFFDTVHFPDSLQRYPFRGRGMYRLEGRVCQEFGCYSLQVEILQKLPWKSRGY